MNSPAFPSPWPVALFVMIACANADMATAEEGPHHQALQGAFCPSPGVVATELSVGKPYRKVWYLLHRKQARELAIVFADRPRSIFVWDLEKDRISREYHLDDHGLYSAYTRVSLDLAPNENFVVARAICSLGDLPLPLTKPGPAFVIHLENNTVHALANYSEGYDVQFDRNRPVFGIRGTKQAEYYNDQGLPLGSDVTIEEPPPRHETARVWQRLEYRLPQEERGIFCRDDSGNIHRLTQGNLDHFAVTADGFFVGVKCGQEFALFRLSNAEEVFRARIGWSRFGKFRYDAAGNQFIWGSNGDQGEGSSLIVVKLVPARHE